MITALKFEDVLIFPNVKEVILKFQLEDYKIATNLHLVWFAS